MAGSASHQIALLADLFTSGGWQQLRVESHSLSLLLSNDRNVPCLGRAQTAPTPVASAPVAAPPVAVPVAQKATPRAKTVHAAANLGWVEVLAPNLGTFYRSPKPGAAPFVEVGQKVAGDTEICLLEVMKLFTSVKAGVNGTIREICVDDGILVEGGQLLFRVEAD